MIQWAFAYTYTFSLILAGEDDDDDEDDNEEINAFLYILISNPYGSFVLWHFSDPVACFLDPPAVIADCNLARNMPPLIIDEAALHIWCTSTLDSVQATSDNPLRLAC